MIGDIIIGEHKQTTAMRFRNIERYESYFSNIDMGYDADDCIVTGFIYKLYTSEFNLTDQNMEKERILNDI